MSGNFWFINSMSSLLFQVSLLNSQICDFEEVQYLCWVLSSRAVFFIMRSIASISHKSHFGLSLRFYLFKSLLNRPWPLRMRGSSISGCGVEEKQTSFLFSRRFSCNSDFNAFGSLCLGACEHFCSVEKRFTGL